MTHHYLFLEVFFTHCAPYEVLAGVRKAGYTPHQQVLEARHCDACQHRERLVVVAVRNDLRRRCGEFCLPPPVSGQRPAKTIPTPLVKYEGKRFSSADFVRCDPVHYMTPG
jgi:site-specific DNA-cytosine methylase